MQAQELVERVAGLNECKPADLQGLVTDYPSSFWVDSEEAARLAARALTALGYSPRWHRVEAGYTDMRAWTLVVNAQAWLVEAVAASAQSAARA